MLQVQSQLRLQSETPKKRGIRKEEKGISLAHTSIVQSAVLVTSVSCECALNPGFFLFSFVKQL